jgi:hypothetical protein
MKRIPLTQNKWAIVDDEDYENLSGFKWRYSHGYAIRHPSRAMGKRKNIFMHREIMQTPQNMATDHINLDTLDNRRSNLRVCTHGQNQANRGKLSNNTSGYKGVSWHKSSRKWAANIRYMDKQIYLGKYTNKEDAAQAYDRAALKYYGEFAILNF